MRLSIESFSACIVVWVHNNVKYVSAKNAHWKIVKRKNVQNIYTCVIILFIEINRINKHIIIILMFRPNKLSGKFEIYIYTDVFIYLCLKYVTVNFNTLLILIFISRKSKYLSERDNLVVICYDFPTWFSRFTN